MEQIFFDFYNADYSSMISLIKDIDWSLLCNICLLKSLGLNYLVYYTLVYFNLFRVIISVVRSSLIPSAACTEESVGIVKTGCR